MYILVSYGEKKPCIFILHIDRYPGVNLEGDLYLEVNCVIDHLPGIWRH